MDEIDSRVIRGELRKIRDGIEVIAGGVAYATSAGTIFSGMIFPRPEGWLSWAGWGFCLFMAWTTVQGIRERV